MTYTITSVAVLLTQNNKNKLKVKIARQIIVLSTHLAVNVIILCLDFSIYVNINKKNY